MSIKIHFQGGPRAGEVVEFGDDCQRITIGRDKDRCQLVFPADEVRVGREHCALRRELGRYRLVLNREDVVLIDGKPAIDDQELPLSADLQLGKTGPKLVVQTLLAVNMQPTIERGNQPGKATLLREAGASAQRGRQLAIVALVLVVLVGAASYRWWSRLFPSVADLGEKQEAIGKKQQDIDQRQQEITANQKQLTEQQKTLLADMASKLEQAQRDAKSQNQKLAQVLSQAAESVYLVIRRNAEGDEEPEATAWVANQAQGILATNGHVAELFTGLQPGYQILVRSTSEPPLDFVVKSVTIHPGYSAFDDLWNRFQPTRRTDETSSERVVTPGGCDVALMYVEGQGLGVALPLAGAEVLRSLGAGNPVGSVGFPSERMALGGVNLKQPTPTTHMAYLTAITNYFGASRVDDSEKLLLQHAIPSTGGASGSPILNPDGQVVGVLNAGNLFFINDMRVGSAVLVNFGQRSDLVAELLSGTADAVQPARTSQWETALSRYFQPAEQVDRNIRDAVRRNRELVLNDAIEQWKTRVSSELNVAGFDEVVNVSNTLSDLGQVSQSFDVPQGGRLFVGAMAHSADQLGLDLYDTAAGTRQGGPYTIQPWRDWLPTCELNLTGPTSFEAAVGAGAAAGDYTLRVVLARVGSADSSTLPVASDDEQRKILTDAWIRTIDSFGIWGYRAEQVFNSSGWLFGGGGDGSSPSTLFDIPLSDTGSYFAIAHDKGGGHTTLVISQDAFSGFNIEVGADRSDTAWPSAAWSVSDAGTSHVAVFGTAAFAEVEVWVYRAVVPSSP